jgi:hypothetical protein
MARKLVLVALIALVACTGFGFKASCTAPATEWRLTVRATGGGFVNYPGEGMFWYDDGDVVSLKAVAPLGYRFVKWSGNVRTVADIYHAETRIYMNLDYTITAEFAPVGECDEGW